MTENEFLQLIRQHELIIHKVCTIYARSKDDKQDLFQEIILNAWKGVQQFRNESKFSTWLYRVALNTAMTVLRKEKKEARIQDAYPLYIVMEDSTSDEQ